MRQAETYKTENTIMSEEEIKEFAHTAINLLETAVTESGYSISGATDYRAEDLGAPPWVCNARGSIASYYGNPALWTDSYLVFAHERGCFGQDADDSDTADRYRAMASIANRELVRRLSLKR